jgi:alanine dehydrogenase
MRIGIPTEIKTREFRVALVPEAASELVRGGHEVWIQSGAGLGTGFDDDAYTRFGVRIADAAGELWDRAEMIVKVKEPLPDEYDFLRADHLLFCFLHLAAVPELACALMNRGTTAVAFETVRENGRLPILAPMSEIAGRIAAQVGTTLLEKPNGGRGILLGGVASADRGHVVVLGAGSVGLNAASVAMAMGARVTIVSRGHDSLMRAHALGGGVTAFPAYADLIEKCALEADLLIGAVLVPGARAPRAVTADAVSRMKAGSVIVDVSVDQGGCVETTRATTWEDPTYVVDDVVHFAVTNIPGAVPLTSSQALSSALYEYVLRLAADREMKDPVFRNAVNVEGGKIVHPAVREALEGAM